MEIEKTISLRQSHHVLQRGDVWYAYIGINIGVEINGKGDDLIRPVYVYKVVNKDSFICIPLVSQINIESHRLCIDGRIGYLSYMQIRALSTKRCIRFLTQLKEDECQNIEALFHRMLCKYESPS